MQIAGQCLSLEYEITRLATKFLASVEPESLLQCSQQLSISPVLSLQIALLISKSVKINRGPVVVSEKVSESKSPLFSRKPTSV
jgi:hypothetical protein